MNNNALILANGEPPTKKLMKRLLAGSPMFVCADGGANTAARYKLKPSAIVGDLDSISTQAMKALRKAEIHKVVNDYSTDLEKTLSWVIDKGFHAITVAGATGGRLDHFIGNLSALVKFSGKASITFTDDTGEWIFIDRSKNLSLPVGTTVSLIPVSRCDGIVTKGLRWNVNFESLELGVRDGTSNITVDSSVHISVAKGNLILFHLFKPAAAQSSRSPKKRMKR
jgi:thiamine pyrophosphokinase